MIRAIDIYGPNVESLKGKSVTPGTVKHEVVHVPKLLEKTQKIHADICYVEKVPFLSSVVIPLGLLMTTHVSNDKDIKVVKNAFTAQLTILSSKGFKVNTIIIDPDTVLSMLEHHLQGVDVNIVAPGMHVVIAEREIRLLKERCRACIAGFLGGNQLG